MPLPDQTQYTKQNESDEQEEKQLYRPLDNIDQPLVNGIWFGLGIAATLGIITKRVINSRVAVHVAGCSYIGGTIGAWYYLMHIKPGRQKPVKKNKYLLD